jgi:hypothetical protein
MGQRICMVVLCVLIVGTFTVLAGGADKKVWEGEGERINIYYGPEAVTISSSDPCWVRGGWGGPVGPGDNSDELHNSGWVINGGYYFELYINDEEVKLQRCNAMIPQGTPGDRYGASAWGIQFPSGYFAPGEYALTGVLGCRNPRNGVNVVYELPSIVTVLLTVVGP